MEVQRVATQYPAFAQAAKLCIADGARRAPVVHGVAANTARIGRFDNNVPAEIRDFSTVGTVASVVKLDCLIEHDAAVPERGDDAFFGLRIVSRGLAEGVLGVTDD